MWDSLSTLSMLELFLGSMSRSLSYSLQEPILLNFLGKTKMTVTHWQSPLLLVSAMSPIRGSSKTIH